MQVALGLGGGEDHGLKRDRVGAVELVGPEAAQVIDAPCGRSASRASRRRSSRARVTRLVVPVRASPCTSAQEPSARCSCLRKRTPSRIARSTSSRVTAARSELGPIERTRNGPAARPITIQDRALGGRCMAGSRYQVERGRRDRTTVISL